MSSAKKPTAFPTLPDTNQGTKAPTGKYRPEIGLAKQQQHHDRPEYAAQTKLQSQYVMEGVGRNEAKRMAKTELYVPKRK